MLTPIKFGTSGWRGVIADEFTFANVRRALTGMARYVRSVKPQGARVIVGRDPRFLGEVFIGMAAEVLQAHGITPLVIADPAPTPAISFAVTSLGTDGAVNFTASHNPAEYNGIKFSTPDGAPALVEVTRKIESEIQDFDASAGKAELIAATRDIETIEVRTAYLRRLAEVIELDIIRKSGLKVVFDPLYGAGQGYSDTFLKDAGIRVTTIHDCRDVLFGGQPPEPDDHVLSALRQTMKSAGASIGISTDGDADRFGILDADGSFISPNHVIALLFDYLVETRGWKNGVAKSVVTTNLINSLAQHHGIELHETPVGFKYIGELIKQDKIVIGGEESAGLSIRHHVPEKDGIIAGLLCCEMVARRGKPMRMQLEALFAKFGSYHPLRENFRLTPEVKAQFTSKLGAEPAEFAGHTVKEVVRKDGLKLVLDDGSWVCFRLSGTEPVVRVYSEARTVEGSGRLSQAAKTWIFG